MGEELRPAKLHSIARAFEQDGRVAIVGHSSVLVFAREGEDANAVIALSEALIDDCRDLPAADRQMHELDVVFDERYGPDLPLLFREHHLEPAQFLARVSEIELTVRFLGFRPGFAYLDGWPLDWRLPRRAAPRASVPGGSFAVAGAMAGFYPSDSPGGWNLLGRSSARFWDPNRNPPNLLSPGDLVRLRPVADLEELETTDGRKAIEETSAVCRIESSGIATFLVHPEDLTRCSRGLPAGGAFDEALRARLAAAVGSSHGAALECTARGPRLRFLRDARLAWAGAAAEVRRNGALVDSRKPIDVSTNDELEVGVLHGSLRGLLAFSEPLIDLQAPPQSIPRRLQRGDLIGAGSVAASAKPSTPPGSYGRGDAHLLEVMVGPHETDATALREFFAARWSVSKASDRTGIRLTGRVGHRPPSDLPSCGAQCGTIQWHPNGEIVILGPDHPVTGGYHQVATVRQRERWKLARLMPGETLMLIAT